MNIINLTPHQLNLMPAGPDGPMVVIPTSGTVARCTTSRMQVGAININGVSVPINRTQFGAVDGLPDPQPDTIFIVSSVVAQAVPDLLQRNIQQECLLFDKLGRTCSLSMMRSAMSRGVS